MSGVDDDEAWATVKMVNLVLSLDF